MGIGNLDGGMGGRGGSGAEGSWEGLEVYTIGHSTRSVEELVAALRSFGVDRLIDIRTIPRSRHNPQFNEETLPDKLKGEGIRYLHVEKLGGLRHPRKDSPNDAWRNASFRGFADYMQSPEFEEGLAILKEQAEAVRPAIMCAEAVPWRCHRSLIADVLVARGAKVEHISGDARSKPHRMTRFAKVRGGHVTYPRDGDAS